jgi:hypothetical protein
MNILHIASECEFPEPHHKAIVRFTLVVVLGKVLTNAK